VAFQCRLSHLRNGEGGRGATKATVQSTEEQCDHHHHLTASIGCRGWWRVGAHAPYAAGRDDTLRRSLRPYWSRRTDRAEQTRTAPGGLEVAWLDAAMPLQSSSYQLASTATNLLATMVSHDSATLPGVGRLGVHRSGPHQNAIGGTVGATVRGTWPTESIRPNQRLCPH